MGTAPEPERREAQSWKPLDLVRWTTGYFAKHGIPTPRLDAEVLLAHVLDCTRLRLYTHFDQPIEQAERDRYRELIRRRAQDRVPVAYLTGEREFWSQRFRVSPHVLVPRSETETLVRAVLSHIAGEGRVLEVGVGSGAGLAALALERPELRLVGTDISRPALDVAVANLEALGLKDRVELHCCGGLDPLDGDFTLIVSNPPYLTTRELADVAPELRHEPRIALDGGADGLDVIRSLVAGAAERLVRGGWLLLEIGAGQAQAVRDLLRAAGASRLETHPDLAGVERVVGGRFGKSEGLES